ncbi:hypothetical protein BS50DRAFT_624993 [Corynespora cassiicola Philippines]|uniref:FAR-17a/AIG1-like protein n=1 Tax=Corynespora cassiicola Philippines TaxID=1448308 RepID=A0A2T2NA24_CORCC|nr:hypothetical protein BS50DRAFT_624993 [Corynespora cassiicola Philippines]
MAVFNRSPPSSAVGFDPTARFETSWVFPPILLFLLRLLFSLYAFTTIFFIFGWNGTHGEADEIGHSFSYFTHLTYWGLAFYYAFSALHTLSYWLTATPWLNRWPKAFQIAHSVYYSTIVVFPFIVTGIAVYWALLAPSSFPSTFSIWTNMSQHALNSLYALFEIIFPRTEPMPFWHLVPLVIILAMYLGLAYLTAHTQGFYVYGFLDLSKNSSGKVAGYIVGILVACIIVFLIVRYVVVLRVWLTEKKLGMTGKFGTRRGSRMGDEEVGKAVPLHDYHMK